MAQPTKAAWGVTEALGGLGGRDPLDEVGAEGFVLAVGGVGRFEEDLPDVAVCYLYTRLTRHTTNMSHQIRRCKRNQRAGSQDLPEIRGNGLPCAGGARRETAPRWVERRLQL